MTQIPAHVAHFSRLKYTSLRERPLAGPARLVLSVARLSNSSRETVEGEGRTLLAVLPLETPPLTPPLASPRMAPLAEAGSAPRGVRA